MNSSPTLQQRGLETAATIRRAWASFNQEMTEFSLAASADSCDQMETARRLAHDHLDCFFDGVAAAQALGRNEGTE